MLVIENQYFNKYIHPDIPKVAKPSHSLAHLLFLLFYATVN